VSKIMIGILVMLTVILGLVAEIFLFTILGFGTLWSVLLGVIVVGGAVGVGWYNAVHIQEKYLEEEHS